MGVVCSSAPTCKEYNVMAAGVACFVQTCDQVITGRQFQYDRSIEIIQEEEYLEDVDFDDIKRYDLLKKIGNPTFNIPRSSQYSNWASAENNHKTQKYHGKYQQKWQKKIQGQNTRGPSAVNHFSPTKKHQKMFGAASPSAPQAPPGLQR